MAATLRENHIRHALGVQIDVLFRMVLICSPDTKFGGGFINDLVDQTIDLLAVV